MSDSKTMTKQAEKMSDSGTMTKQPEKQNEGDTVELRREIGLFSAVNLILGVMIGSGIFVSPSSALEYSGSVGLCLIIWTVSGVISLLGGCR